MTIPIYDVDVDKAGG